MSTYPRKPTDQEKDYIAGVTFPGTPVSEVDFTDVWMLAAYNNDLDFNCFAWSILAISTISIPDKLDTLEYLAGRAKEREGAPYNYMSTDRAEDAVILAWGSKSDTGKIIIMHASRSCTKSLLQSYAGEFNLSFDFSEGSPGEDFPSDTIWTSKFGDRLAFITHPRNWLSGGVWGTEQGALMIKE